MTDPLLESIRRRAAEPSGATDASAEFPQPAPPPLDAQSIAAAESALAWPLPELLRDIYLRVANGGVGPGYGLLPLFVDAGSTESDSVVSLYSALSSTDTNDKAWKWPAGLVPFCEWGCAIRSCVDCSSPDAPVFTFDPGARHVEQDMSAALARTHSNLRSWFADWLADVKLWDLMFEPDPSRARTGVNPFTKKPISFVPNRLRRL